MNRLFHLLPMLALALPLAAIAPMAAQRLPDAPEKNTFLKVCSGCHPPEAVAGRMDTPKNWARKVESMMNRGAEATPEEITLINAYLNRDFLVLHRPKVLLAEDPGKQALQKRSAARAIPRRSWSRAIATPACAFKWSETIDRMLARGAQGLEARNSNRSPIILAANFGYIPVPSYLPKGPGKEIVERVCGPCHGVSLLIEHHASRAEWERTVNNMIGRGCGCYLCRNRRDFRLFRALPWTQD